jgi:hypothetical protein
MEFGNLMIWAKAFSLSTEIPWEYRFCHEKRIIGNREDIVMNAASKLRLERSSRMEYVIEQLPTSAIIGISLLSQKLYDKGVE